MLFRIEMYLAQDTGARVDFMQLVHLIESLMAVLSETANEEVERSGRNSMFNGSGKPGIKWPSSLSWLLRYIWRRCLRDK